MNQQVKSWFQELTLEEKISLCSGQDFWHSQGIERLKIPAIMMCDGPHGLRKQENEADHMGINQSIETVCYPTASALAASFDVDIMKKLGEALGKECQAEQVGMLLGPGLNMKRSPLCGRNFEYFSEDPYLAGKVAASYVKALQSEGVAACVKHFAVNNQESHRMSGSSNLDERTLYEIYFPAFETAVKEGGTESVMCAYNGINGSYCSENKELLTEILRNQWGFKGMVVTDWGAAKDAVRGVEAGLNLVMPGGYGAHESLLKKALNEGEITEEDLDAVLSDILQFIWNRAQKQKRNVSIDRKACAKLSEDMAVECAVLMKNENILPLKKNQKVAFIGEYAIKPRYQGSGSSRVNVPNVRSALDYVEDKNVIYARGYYSEKEQSDGELLEEAVKAAKESQAAVIFAGLPASYETEGVDRKSMKLPDNQNELIEAVARVQKNLIIVLHCGAPVEIPWEKDVKAILCMYLGGQGVGKAAVRLLYGEDNPCGKLAETWPIKLEDNPSFLNFPGVDGQVDYREGVFIGYRYYDRKKMEVRYPFGHGLSYTSFTYSGLSLSRETMTDRETLTVSLKVKNIGKYRGKEAVQLYVGPVYSSVPRPVRELKGFKKVELEPGEEKEVRFTLDKRSFAYYEPRIHDWFVESGRYRIEAAASSRDVRLEKIITIEGTREIPYHYTVNSPMESLKKTAKGRLLLNQMMTSMQGSGDDNSALGEGAENMQQAMQMEMPLGAFVGFGVLSEKELEKTLLELNNYESTLM